MKKYNQKYIKARNQGKILKLLYFNSPKTRAQISRETGIVRSTISELTNELINFNIIYEGNKISGNIGKRPTLLHFNKDLYCFIALVITGVEIDIALCNLKGAILCESRVKLNEDMNAMKIIELAFHNTDKMISSIDKDKIILISLGSPETFSKETGIIKWSPYIHDWVGVNLKSVFQDKYKKAVIIKDHVKLETLGEYWHSFNSVYNLVYIVITKGIGSGVIIDGELREGKNGYLGEIGFLPILNRLDDNKCGNNLKGLGPFEAKCDIKKIEKIVNSYLVNKGIIQSAVSFDEIVQYYNTNADVKKLIHEEIVGVLTVGIASVIIMLDPEIVVINGEIIWLGEDFLQLLRKKLYSMIPFKTEVVYSKLKERSKIYGAIRNGLIYIEDQMFNNIESFLKRNLKSDMI